jgi:uncharacterized protein (DUF1499 family)
MINSIDWPRALPGECSWPERFSMKKSLAILVMIAILHPALAMSSAGADTVEGEKAMKTLRPCPSSPNCVSSQAADPRRRMAPIPFAGRAEAARKRLRAIITALPRAEITRDEPGYLAAAFRSRIFGFVDEAEFVFDEGKSLIHFRSGARTGSYDFGVNRSRMERITEAFRGDE